MNLQGIAKCPTGISGLDQITLGGLPAERPTLVCGSAGCGKTLMGMEFLVRGATQFDEPGVFISFEENIQDLIDNVASLGFDVQSLMDRNLIAMDQILIDRNDIEESGDFDLTGLFLRLELAIDSVGAKRIVIDTIETLFGAFTNYAILRSELGRLFRWLKEKKVTAIITGERGDGTLTRQGLEEYVSDCVILLDHRTMNQISTRRLRIVKYRGSSHGTNEYPFLIDERGFSVLPITSMGLAHDVSEERISTGIERLDHMLSGGFYRGSSVLVSGTAGTGKTTIACYMAEASCRRGEKALYFAFEESPSQIKRNLATVGLDLNRWEREGLLHFHATRPMLYGLEMHLVSMTRMIEEVNPQIVIVDPITSLVDSGTVEDANAALLRLVDFLKARNVTALFTSLNHGGESLEATIIGISSLMDSWLLLRDIELGGERNRGMYVLKARGIQHSNQIREFVITPQGVDLLDVYVGPEGVLTGSMRVAQEVREQAAALERELQAERRQRELERRKKSLEAQIQALRAEYEAEAEELLKLEQEANERSAQVERNRRLMATSRKADNGS